VESTKKAYQLRDRVSEFENFAISKNYQIIVTGDLEKALQVIQQWNQAYPHNANVLLGLADCYGRLGRYDEMLETELETVQLSPANTTSYLLLGNSYMHLNRSDEARATIQQARALHLDSPFFALVLWRIAYLQGDQAGMAANGALARRVAPDTDALMALDQGHISRLRDAIQRIVTAEMRANHKENAAAAESSLALTEALIGDLTEAKASAMKAAQMSENWDTVGPGGVALALAGDLVAAQKLAADLNQRYPQATRAQFYYLPAIRAALALRQDKPQQAIESLSNASS
jgi:tetratricopeptide (TPR) repeat protein